MQPDAEQPLRRILAQFDLDGEICQAIPYGEGHINTTFRATDDGGRQYILQRINTDTFRDPDALMENICGVTEYLRRQIAAAGGDPRRETLRVRRTRDGRACLRDEAGGVWRVYDFIADTLCLQQARSADDLFTAGETFGRFQRMLDGYPAQTLHQTIPRFHDTPKRHADLLAAAQADPAGRAAGCAAELAFAQARAADCRVLTDRQAAGRLPLRVTHNDTKLNNVLLDRATGRGLCVIDLDTVMPGLSLNDFGDTVRSAANTCAEDEPDLSKVHFSLPLFEAFTRGFLAGCGPILTDAEKQSLPWGARLMTLECGIRFLTDYLEGDRYFRTSRPGQNLDRARTQFKLVADMERDWAAMNAITARCRRG